MYQKTINQLRKKILRDLKENGPKKNIFLEKISQVIGEWSCGRKFREKL